MGEVIHLERHVLASPATVYDTAWCTYGVTPGARHRAGRLEEEVPWGTHVSRAADPPRLSGPAEAVLDPSNFDRLGQAVLPLDGWLGFSLWGAFGPPRAGSGGRGERRVLTHTLLSTRDAFRRLGGHPAGLLRVGGAPAPWVRRLTEASAFSEPVVLEPVRVAVDRASRDALVRARLEELARLRGLVLTTLGGETERLRATLSAVYEALARTRAEDGLRSVVVRGVGTPVSSLLRLVWLSLPLEDRLEVSFVSEQRRTERPRASLLGLPEAEWGRFVPEGSWVLGEDEAFQAAPGRDHWARAVAAPGFPDGFDRLDARARRGQWRLVGAGDVDAEAARARWWGRWRAEGPTVAGVRELWGVESRRAAGPRARAVGSFLGRTGREPLDPAGRDSWLADAGALLDETPRGRRAAVVRGAVRELRRRGAEGRRRAARLRCLSVAEGWVPAAELRRLVDRESDALRALLTDPSRGGGLHLVVAALSGRGGVDPVGRELVRLGVAETGWTRERAEAVADALERPGAGPGGARDDAARGAADPGMQSVPPDDALDVLLEALDAGREPFGAPRSRGRRELAEALARRVLRDAAAGGLGEEGAETVLRCLWTAGSERALDALEESPSVKARVLAELLVHPAPVPLFHRIRERLSEALARASGGDSGPGASLGRVGGADLSAWAPALAARLGPAPGERRIHFARGR